MVKSTAVLVNVQADARIAAIRPTRPAEIERESQCTEISTGHQQSAALGMASPRYYAGDATRLF